VFIGVWLFEETVGGGTDLDNSTWDLEIHYDAARVADLGADEAGLQLWYYADGATDWVQLTNAFVLDTDADLIGAAGEGAGMYAIVIPEPGTMALLALGGVGMLLRRRKRRAAA